MRRISVRSATALGALGIAVSLAVVAAAAAKPFEQASPQIKKGGTLTIGLAEDPDVLDPTLARTFVGRIVFAHMCEKLYDLNAKLRIVPQLAASLPTFSADKRSVTIRLRRGIRFNDGSAFNAAAVKKSLDRHRTMARSTRASELSPVTSVDVTGPYTVVLRLDSRYSPITAQLADRAGMIMSPAQIDKLGDRFGSDPVCVGPFVFKDRAAGDHITLTRSSVYYGRAKVRLDQIVFRIITDPSARTQNLRAGDIQVEDRIQSQDIPVVSRDKRLRLIKATSIGYQGITINIGNKNGIARRPFENVGTAIARAAALRRAFSLALDRSVINRVVFGGTVQPDCFPFAPSTPWYAAAKGIPCYKTAQVKAAQRLFNGTSAAKPTTVRMMIGTDPVAARLGQTIQAMVSRIGFRVELDPTEFVTALARNDAGNYQTFAVGWSGRIDPDGNLYQFVHSKGSQNTSGYANSHVDLTLDNARKAATTEARLTNYRAALRDIARDMPIIYLYHAVTRDGVSQRVGGVQLFGDGLIRAGFAYYK
jgi:peptide/nickel transport system substrate-binding protein